MSKLPVITISRQYKSGGRMIARMLAEALGVPYYDNELITMAAKKSGYSPDLFENADQNATNSLLFTLSMYGSAGAYESSNIPIGDKIYLIQSEIIKSVAEKGPSVIVGRCANYILRDHENHLSVFLRAPMPWRVNRAVSLYNLPKESAESTLRKTDKKRAVYYAHFSGDKWGDPTLYDMSVDVSCLGPEKTAELLEKMARLKADL